MKKCYLLFPMLSLFFLACKKEKVDVGDFEKYPFTFNVILKRNSHQNKKAPVLTNSSDTTEKLYYIVYDNRGRLMKMIGSSSILPGFGTIKDSLKAGSYTCVFIGGRGNLRVAESPIEEDFFTSDDEVFYRKEQITVPSTAANSTVIMERITARIVVNIEDPIPAGFTNITVRVNDHSRFSILNDAMSSGFRYLDLISELKPTDIGKKNFRLSGTIFNTNDLTSVTIQALGSNALNITKEIQNVQFKKNTITTLTGALFAYPGSGFHIDFEDYSVDTLVANY